MNIISGRMVSLGYGNYFRSDSIVGFRPLPADERGVGHRTEVFIEDVDEPIIVSRTENTILRDLVEEDAVASWNREKQEILQDIYEGFSDMNPMLISIVRDQSGGFDIVDMLERLKEVVNTG